jgi:hypothetical protein
VVEYLPSKQKALSSNPSFAKKKKKGKKGRKEKFPHTEVWPIYSLCGSQTGHSPHGPRPGEHVNLLHVLYNLALLLRKVSDGDSITTKLLHFRQSELGRSF